MTLTNEEKLLGVTEESKEKKATALTDKALYTIKLTNFDNESVVTGAFLKRMLPLFKQNELIYGAKELNYNGFEIKVFEADTDTEDYSKLKFDELKALCVEKGIDITGLKSKAELIDKLKEE